MASLRASWKVNRSYGSSGPWVIQLALSSRGSIDFDSPLPQHRNFPTRAAAQAVKRTLPTPFIHKGIVIDGVTIAGCLHCGKSSRR